MERESVLPDWLYDATYDDTLFAGAYEQIDASLRALLKTCIARLYDWYGPALTSRQTIHTDWTQGFTSAAMTMPRRRCLVLFDSSTGPAALLAALVPARTAGVPGVAAVFVGEGVPGPALLAALELAGQEVVVPDARLDELLTACGGPDGCVVALGGTSRACTAYKGPLWAGPTHERIGVWMDNETPIDMDALTFAHPTADVTIMSRDDGTVEELLAQHLQALFGPARLSDDVLHETCLFLGPGQEGCWVYPGLSAAFFHTHHISWT